MKNKETIIITGATSQIGRHITYGLAQPGTRLILHTYRNQQEADRLKKKGDIVVVTADLATLSGINSFIQQTLPYGPFNFFLHNAGSFEEKSFEKLMNLHVFSALEISRKIAPYMKPQSHITLISDIGAHIPFKKHPDYCLSKGAALSLMRSLAVKLAPSVLVNCLTLGPIMPAKTESKKIKKLLEQRTLLKRWGGAKEVLRAIQFLRASTFITGTEIILDGGYQLVPRV